MLRHVLLTALLCCAAVPAVAKEYRADRFDAQVEVLRGGALRVTETIVFTFSGGTFREVFRTVPTRRTDGLEFVEASMDGRVLPPGDGPGEVEIRRRNGMRVIWRFPPVTGTHTFVLTYVARGVVTVDGEEEVLQWRALPREHRYAIDASTIEFRVPAAPTGRIGMEKHRVDGRTELSLAGEVVTFHATGIRRNGWVEPSLRFARGTLLDAPPEWQQRQAVQRAMAPTWLTVAGSIVALGLLLLVMLRQGYDSPPRESATDWSSVIAPDALPPAVAAALVANGEARLEQAVGALLGLAERGVVRIEELPKRTLGQRDFMIVPQTQSADLAPHERALLDVIASRADRDGAVRLSKIRGHLIRHWKRFRQALVDEMRELELYDPTRAAHRARYNHLAIAVLVLAGLTAIAAALVVPRFGPWPLLISAGLVVVAITSLMFAAAETPLSNEGIRRAENWRAYQKHLRRPQEIEPRWGGSPAAEARILPYAVALGLAAPWAKFMKKRGITPPAWFRAASDLDSGAAFAAFIATGGATAHGSGGGGFGGAAGGGASGAR
ncbi:MAG TPA: DUF2207 domain-containing protein [Vicinamibacterales bacterium]|nr:DUF2207 domain-containing protein [Vicinamibacterales bacterium]